MTHRPEADDASANRYRENAVAQKIIDCIHRGYDRRITLSELADAVSYSPGECCRVFKRVTGETIFSYLRSYRLTRGMELLRDTDLSVSRIAYDIGFCTASYFTETFKARLGVTPLQYRKESQQAMETK